MVPVKPELPGPNASDEELETWEKLGKDRYDWLQKNDKVLFALIGLSTWGGPDKSGKNFQSWEFPNQEVAEQIKLFLLRQQFQEVSGITDLID